MSSNINAVNPVANVPTTPETHAVRGHGGKGGHGRLNQLNAASTAATARPPKETRPAATITISSDAAHNAPPRTPIQLEGFVTELTPTETGSRFTLQGEGHHHVGVAFTGETRIIQPDNGSVFPLANGQYVQVAGILDRQTKTVNAATIERVGATGRLGELRA